MFHLKLANFFFTRLFKFFYRKSFKSFGTASHILFPLKINGLNNISIGNKVQVSYKSWLAAVPLTGKECILKIGDGTVIGNFNHIYATRSIIIGQNVLTADKVYISDNLHDYEDVFLPIKDQPVKQIGVVEIGDGSWVGENACVLGAKIGRNCVIGANSVVTKNIPDYSVAVGVPAKIIKRFCFHEKRWITTDAEGNFLY